MLFRSEKQTKIKGFKKRIMDSSIAISLILGGSRVISWWLLNGIEIFNSKKSLWAHLITTLLLPNS